MTGAPEYRSRRCVVPIGVLTLPADRFAVTSTWTRCELTGRRGLVVVEMDYEPERRTSFACWSSTLECGRTRPCEHMLQLKGLTVPERLET